MICHTHRPSRIMARHQPINHPYPVQPDARADAHRSSRMKQTPVHLPRLLSSSRTGRHSGIERAAARPCAPMQAKIRSAHGRDRARDRDRPTRAYWPRCRRCCCPYKARRRQRPLGRARVVLLLPARQGCPHCLPGRARARALARPIVSMYVHFRYVLVCYDSIDLAYSVILIPFTRHT